MSIAEEKAALRGRIREARRGLGQEERAASAEAVAERIAALPQFCSARGVVLAYMPMKYELDILPAVNRLMEMGWQAAFPLCIEDGGLRLFIPSGEDGFRVGAYGILEPDADTAREIEAADLSAILLPAVGFDISFNRLGQGGGYYDRLLARTDCFTVAVGFDCQLVGSVPTEPTDRRVDAVITPTWSGVRR